MLGRKSYTADELMAAQRIVDRQLNAYRALVEAVDKTGDASARAAVEELEPELVANLALALDRVFVHRTRPATGKESTPLNELEVLTDALMGNDGVVRGVSAIRYQPEQTVLGLAPGDRVRLTADRFAQLARAVLGELDEKFRE